MTLSEELTWRGFVNQTTFSSAQELDSQSRTFYFGVDPSADSMQIGNLAAAMMCRHFINHGYKAILLVGGATGVIGDPDGKKQERDLKSLEEIAKNKQAIAAQYSIVFAGQEFEVVDNYDWFKNIGYLDFLRIIGKNVPMSQMLGREFVQSRLSEEGEGISYAEFSYSLIQGYDFLHLFREKGVTLQLSGADQWGNSLAGVDLIRRVEGGEAHVWTAPLIIDKSTGKKFGKSEGGAIWLDANKTSAYKFYQFWINLDDEGVEDYLKVYTLLDKDSIDGLMIEQRDNPSGRAAQKRLGLEVTSLVHGQQRAESVQRVSEVLFGGREYSELQPDDLKQMEAELTTIEVGYDTPLVDILVGTNLASSKSEARRFLEASAIHINGMQFSSEKTALAAEDNIHNYAVIRRGKNTVALVKITSS